MKTFDLDTDGCLGDYQPEMAEQTIPYWYGDYCLTDDLLKCIVLLRRRFPNITDHDIEDIFGTMKWENYND